MSVVRRATPEDAEELLRLRQVMIDSMFANGSAAAIESDTSWHAESLIVVRARLAEREGNFAAFVIDRPDRPGRPGQPDQPGPPEQPRKLAALVVGTLDYRIGRAGNPRGVVGQVFSVATDPDQRRRGYARACMEVLLDWFRERGAGSVDLNASAEAEPLYASLGFVRKPDPSMRLSL
ncbi:GNAT family N-acetyltransferase [Streptomyces sp. NPDC058268]|uniref:GNAT family N-acetyltransferase n=1 Tax=Streptomyces sp. NPDC058268 TaxID=3346413 RepID=UPI0036F1658D